MFISSVSPSIGGGLFFGSSFRTCILFAFQDKVLLFLDGVNFGLFFGLSLGLVPLSAGEPGVDALFNELILSDQEGALNIRRLFFFDVEIEGFLNF